METRPVFGAGVPASETSRLSLVGLGDPQRELEAGCYHVRRALRAGLGAREQKGGQHDGQSESVCARVSGGSRCS